MKLQTEAHIPHQATDTSNLTFSIQSKNLEHFITIKNLTENLDFWILFKKKKGKI